MKNNKQKKTRKAQKLLKSHYENLLSYPDMLLNMKMRRVLIGFILVIVAYSAMAQENAGSRSHYDIDVQLQPDSRTLEGSISINFINTSEKSLDSIILNLFPNAYADRNTAFAQQQMRYRETDFYFAEEEDKGFIADLNFTIDGKKTQFHQFDAHEDIIVLPTEKPVEPGTQIKITTDFTVKLPRIFSRSGYENGVFQVSQWFPKLVKLTDDGWVPYAYLDLGEFYSDYADYDVNITVPAAYKVAATGTLQNQEEKEWYKNSADTAMNPTQTDKKTLNYSARQVQDFVWFTGVDFKVDYDTIHIAGKTIECWVFHQYRSGTGWDEAIEYCKRSLKDFSAWVGPYQYPQMTIVGAYLEAGAGMEYPMVSLIGGYTGKEILNSIIAHEVAHNWFYGMIAFDERAYPFLDEGLTSQLEMRYMKKYFPDTIKDAVSFDDFLYWDNIKKRRVATTLQDVNNLTELGYYLLFYRKMPNALEYLRYLVSDEEWDAMMKSLYTEFLFRHVSPQDIQQHFRTHLTVETDWLFDEYLTGKKEFDYRFTDVHQDGNTIVATIENASELRAPLLLQMYKGDTLLQEREVSAFANERQVKLPLIPDADELRIYTGSLLSAYTPKRGVDLLKLKVNKKYLNPGFVLGYERTETQTTFFAPLLAINKYDGLMLGVGMHNFTLPEHNLSYQILPFYGIGSRQPAGLFNVYYDNYSTKENNNRLRLSIEGKKFSSYFNEHYSYLDSYGKLKPALEYRIQKNELDFNETSLRFSSSFIVENTGVGIDYEEKLYEMQRRSYTVWEAEIEHQNTHPINPFSVKLTGTSLEADRRVSLDLKTAYRFKRNMEIGARLYGGLAHSINTTHKSLGFYVAGSTGFSGLDYAYEEYLLGRGELEGLLANQVYNRDLAFPLPVVFPLGEKVIGGDIYLKYEIGKLLSLSPYFYYSSGNSDISGNKLLYSLGTRLSLINDLILINFPFKNASALDEAMTLQGHDTYLSRINFELSISRLFPDNVIKSLFSL